MDFIGGSLNKGIARFMKPLKLFLFVLITALASFCGATPAVAHPSVSMDFFYDSLDPYGEWVEVADYGYCWHPTGVDEDWAPYTDGYWAYTDGGWTWVSYEDFGGITYHYGRWARIEDEGWCWVPDTEWAPAWVSWRENDDDIGWAPLPPRAHFRAEVGFGSWTDAEYDVGPGYYSFCAKRDFGSPALRPVIIDRSRNVTIINNSRNITNITVNRVTQNVFVGGPRYDALAARSARPIQTLRLVRQTDVAAIRAAGGKMLARQQGNQLFVPAPQLTAATAATGLKPARIARTIAAPKMDRGWTVVKDAQERAQLQAKMKEQAGGANPEKNPAKPPTAAELQAVETRIKTATVAAKSTAPAVPPGASQAASAASGGKIVKREQPPIAAPETAVVAQPGATSALAGKAAKGRKGMPISPKTVTDQTSSASAPAVPPAGVSPAPEKASKNAQRQRAQEAAAAQQAKIAAANTAAAHEKKAAKGQGNLQPFMANPAQENAPSSPVAAEAGSRAKHSRDIPQTSAADEGRNERLRAAARQQQAAAQQQENRQNAVAERARSQAAAHQAMQAREAQQMQRAQAAQAQQARAAQMERAQAQQQQAAAAAHQAQLQKGGDKKKSKEELEREQMLGH